MAVREWQPDEEDLGDKFLGLYRRWGRREDGSQGSKRMATGTGAYSPVRKYPPHTHIPYMAVQDLLTLPPSCTSPVLAYPPSCTGSASPPPDLLPKTGSTDPSSLLHTEHTAPTRMHFGLPCGSQCLPARWS